MVDATEVAFVAVFLASDKAWAVSGELVADRENRSDGISLSGDPAAPVLSAGPAHLGDFVSDVAMIPAQTTRDLLNREAAQEHVAQLFQVRLGPVASSLRV